MDLFKKNLAPISNEAWKEIEEQAKDTLKANLSARKFLCIEGPKGWDYPGKTLGRLKINKPKKEGFSYGTRIFLPVVEARISFSLNQWELDNVSRGAEDIDLENLERAAKKIAHFEESVVYDGLPGSDVKGLLSVAESSVTLSKDPATWLEKISKGIEILRNSAISGPYMLVLNPKSWNQLDCYTKGYPLRKQITELLGGKIILSNYLQKNGLIVPANSDDLKLTIGQDFSIGYEHHDSKEIQLFLTETFVFQVNEPKAIIRVETE